MDKPELFDLIIAAIDVARKEQQRSDILLKLTAENSLAKIPKQTVLKVLEDFQRQDGIGVIRLSEVNFPDRYRNREVVGFHSGGTFIPFTTPIREAPPKEDEIHLQVFDGFDNWLASYRLRTRDDLEQITPLTLAKVCITVLAISEKLEASGQPSLQIRAMFQATSPFLPQSFIPSEYRKDALEYMKNKGVVTWYKVNYFSANGVDASLIDLTIDIQKFQEFKSRVIAAYTAKERQLAPPPPAPEIPKPQLAEPGSDTDIIYEVKLTGSREVLLNGLQLSRLEFGSENEVVFSYLFANPNRTITLDELQGKKSADSRIKKTLHKIVENLGFEGDLKDAFFSVTKDSICFRNPIFRKDLEKFGVRWLRFPRRLSSRTPS